MPTLTVESNAAIDALLSTCRFVLQSWGARGVLAGYLYGSVLGSRFREDSDVDIAVLDSETRRLDWADQSLLMVELERAVGRPIDLRMLRDCSASHQAHVFQKGLELWLGDGALVERYRTALLERFKQEHKANEESWFRVLRTLAKRAPGRNEPGLSA